MRRHVPLVAVHRLVNETEHIVLFELGGTLQVGIITVGSIDSECGIVAPLIGITHFDIESGEFLLCLGFGFVAHPSEGGNTLTERSLQILYQLLHTRFCFRREIALYIHLSDSLAECAVYHTYSPFPQWLRLFLTGKYFAVETEVLRIDFVGKRRGCSVDSLPYEERFEVFQRFFCQHLAGFLQMRDLSDRNSVGMYVHCYKESVPVDFGNKLLQLGNRHLIVVGLRVTEFHIVFGSTRQTCFQTKDGLGALFGIVISKEGEHTGKVTEVLVTDHGGVLIGIEIVLLFSESVARLIGFEHIHGAVHFVSVHIYRKHAIVHAPSQSGREFRTALQRFDFHEDGHHRCDTFLIASCSIHSQRI